MAEELKEPMGLILIPWEGAKSARARGAAFRRRGSWVFHVPRSGALWYGGVLGNLEGRPMEGAEATLEGIRDVMRAGLSREAFDRLRLAIFVSNDALARAVGVPLRTLARRRRFKPDESEGLLRVASAFQRSLDAFEDLERARHWFSTPKRALGGKTPLEYCDTGPGAEEVEHLLGRMEHGVFS
jgi:putative toxin-antitoxin system antitoxin component (TIGR02293 family)